MSSSGPGRREVARRVFATEFDDATLSYAESDEERAPNYVVTPTGARVNRLFAVGVLTEMETVSEDYLRARVVDPTGPFVVYAGQYQPEALAFLEEAEPPQFVAVTGKARTYEPDDSDRVFTSIRPEQINAVDAETRDRWTVSAAKQTVDRIGEIAAAAETDLEGDRLRDVLVDNGVEASLADGIPRAIAHYDTTGDYLADLHETALDAARVVAGERDEARPVGRAPNAGDDGPLAELAARTLDTSAAMPGESDEGTDTEEAALTDEPTTETTAADSGAAVGTASADATGSDAANGGSGDAAEQTDEPPAVAATTSGGDGAERTQETASETGADAATPSEDATTSDAATPSDDATTSDDATPVDTDTTDSQADPSMDGASESAVGSTASPTDSESGASDESATAASGGTSRDATDESVGEDPTTDLEEPDLGADDGDAGTDTDAAADDAALDDPLDEDEDIDDFEPEFELDEDERDELEDEFGTEFQSGTEVDEPGSTDLDAPDPDAADAEEPTADDAGAVGDETIEGGDETTEAASESSDAGNDTSESADTADDAAADVDLDDAVVDAMTDLDEGDGADREAVRAAVVDRTGADPGDVDDAIQDALMDGRCYEPDDATLKPI